MRRYWPFDRSQHAADVLLGLQAPYQQMHVLGHVDECRQVAADRMARLVDRGGKSGPPRIVREDRQTPVARKGEFVHVPWLVKVPNRLAMRGDLGHGSVPPLSYCRRLCTDCRPGSSRFSQMDADHAGQRPARRRCLLAVSGDGKVTGGSACATRTWHTSMPPAEQPGPPAGIVTPRGSSAGNFAPNSIL